MGDMADIYEDMALRALDEECDDCGQLRIYCECEEELLKDHGAPSGLT